MPVRPMPRARPTSFRAPVHHVSSPVSRPTFRPPVHHGTPPARPPEHHHPNPLPAIVAATVLNNTINHGTSGSTPSQSPGSVPCHLCGKHTSSAVTHDGENYCQECVGKLLDVVSEQKKAAANEASRSLDKTSVEYLDEQFQAWERGEKDKAAKLGEGQPSVESVRPVENVTGEDGDDDEEEDDDEDDEDHGPGPERFGEAEQVFGSRTRYSSPRPYGGYGSFRRRNQTKQVATVILLMAMIGVGMYFVYPYIASSLIAAPAPTPMYSGPFTGATIHVVDGDTSFDIGGQVAYFDVYVTNDTEDYGAYWWIGNGTTLAGIYPVLGSIDEGLRYASVVLHTDVFAPYADSWDYLLPGENYIYVYK